MAEDSSSEDEITKRILKDSIDTELLTNDLYKGCGSKKPSNKIKSTNSVQIKPSLRHVIEDDGHNQNFIKVTPDFQDHVAKHLFKHLESQIIEKKFKHKNKQVDNTDDCPKGIYLFNGSTKLINSAYDEPTIITKKKHQYNSTSDELILQRASEAAVSPEWILNKDAVQGWEKMTKGKIMEVKRNKEGTFDVVNDEVYKFV